MKSRYIWLAVTADKYELPLAVADSGAELAKKLKVSRNTISAKEHRYRTRTRVPRKYVTKNTHFGEQYRVVKVKIEEE